MRLNSIVQRLFYCLLTIYISLFSVLSMADDIPELSAWMIDKTNTLSAAQQSELNKLLENHEKQTQEQFIVLMIPTLNGESIEEYAVKVFEKWQLGQKGKDNGLLLVIAKNDRKLRIEVGYGLEGKITDAVSGRIIRNDIAPYFKNNDYFGGINHGVQKLLTILNDASLTGGAEIKLAPEASNLLKVINKFLTVIIILIPLLLYAYIKFTFKKKIPHLLVLSILISIVPIAFVYYLSVYLLFSIKGFALPIERESFVFYLKDISSSYLGVIIVIFMLTIIYQKIKNIVLIIFFGKNPISEKDTNKKLDFDSDFFNSSSSSSSSSSSRPSGGGGRNGGGGASGGW